ncbi:uncharacterized protein (DUF1501 family) [Deinobacterium chartae]|uniref:Uncharacterized protein (DUF1501 family) n=1 Tax=Deinobacterium chartae TaxID=521158 RepID=A0A841HZD0_9DEIO|nr:DUF1501 domain-containing protein [Deinobacterium chartae]MBB6097095.1 uncharacterized protein (DUF1501 family) [Deinobacterium chartae]
MNRREFLKLTALATGLMSGMPGFLSRAAAQATGDRTLVVVQLSGGNDGLNTLVPYTNGAYYAARPNIAIPRKDVLTLSDTLGMHPALRPFERLWEAGELAWLENVGYPNPTRSHFASMAIWHSGDPGGAAKDGWIGRIAEKIGDPFCASNVGGLTPAALRGEDLTLPSIDTLETFQLKLPKGLEASYHRMLELPRQGEAAYVQRSTRQMIANTARVQANLKKYRSGARYPESRFARNLQQIAQLIAAGTGQRVLYTSLGGFDTHAGQRAEQDELLATLAEGIAAFHADLEAQGLADRVLIMAFSEFGRRVAENASAGTDHGQGGVMFAIGQGVRGGIHGESPDLEDLDGGDIRYRVDFRGVYAQVLDRWLRLPSQDILGGRFAGPEFVS